MLAAFVRYFSPHLVSVQIVPESARYYIAKGQMEKAAAVVRKIAWYNCKRTPKVRIKYCNGALVYAKCNVCSCHPTCV